MMGIRNGGNVENFRNVMRDIKCHTFSEPQPQADLNDDRYSGNGGNFLECWECQECWEC